MNVSMAWTDTVSEARKWADASAQGFTVSAVDDEARKITLRAPSGSFYVVVPESIGAEDWVGGALYLELLPRM